MASNSYLKAYTAGGLLVTSGDDAVTGIDVASGDVRWKVDLTDDPDRTPCHTLAVAADLDRFYCASAFGEVMERDLATGQLTGRHLDSDHGEVDDLAVARGDELVTFVDGYARWRLDGSGPVARFVAAGSAVDGYDDAGRLLPVASADDGRVAVTDAGTGARVLTLHRGESGAWLGGESMLVRSKLALGKNSSQARLRGPARDPLESDVLDVATGSRQYAPSLPITSDVFRDQVGSGLAWVVSGANGVEVDVHSGAMTGRILPLGGGPQSLAQTKDGRSLWVTRTRWQPSAQADLASFVRLDVATGRVLNEVPDVATAAVSATGQIVTAGSDGTIEERDPHTLRSVARLAGARGRLEQLAFSADGAVLIATADDGTVQLYDTATWTRLATIPSHAPHGVNEGWLRPDGKAVAVNTEQGVAEWTLDPRQLAAAACELAGRNMTRAEWATYMADQSYRRTCPDYPAGT